MRLEQYGKCIVSNVNNICSLGLGEASYLLSVTIHFKSLTQQLQQY